MVLPLLLLAACQRDPVRVDVSPADAALTAILTVKTTEFAYVDVRCTLTDDPDEIHVLSDGEFSKDHRIVFAGLRARGSYECKAEADPGGSVTFDVEAEPLPEGIPDRFEVTKSDTTPMDGVWTLGSVEFEPDEETRLDNLVVVDPEGWMRWALPLGVGPDVDVSLDPDGNILYGGGYTYNPTVVGLDGSLVWQAPDGDDGAYNHHVERMPDGDILTLVDGRDTDGTIRWLGFRIEKIDGETGEVVWKWSSQEAFDNGDLPGSTVGGADYYHANSVSWLDDDQGPAVWVSLRSLSQILRIDRDTMRVSWVLGRDDDFRLIDENGDDAPLADWFYGQHAPEPHPPFVYVYDNGWSRPVDQPFSRVALYQLDVANRTAQVAWAWTEPGWYEPIWGDIDVLASGHVLVTKAHCPSCGSHGVSEIVEIDRITDEVVWRAKHPDGTTGTYRSERLGGCDLFANAKYCPGLLE